MKYFMEILIISFFATTSICYAEVHLDISDDVPNPDAIEAFQQYWVSFSEYEKKISEERLKNLKEKSKKDQEEYDARVADFDKESIAKLSSAEKKYRDHLSKFPSAANTVDILFNLSQIYNLFGQIYDRSSKSLATGYRDKAIDVLSKIERDFPDFSKKGQVLYFLASLLEKQDRVESSVKVWKKLASLPDAFEYVLQANLALGDYHFDRDNPKQAVGYYQAASAIVKSNADFQSFQIDVSYRLAWASYRTTELKLAVKYSVSALTPGLKLPAPSEWAKMKNDLIDILSDSLYEINDFEIIVDMLNTKKIIAVLPDVSDRILSRMQKNDRRNLVAKLGEYAVGKFADSILVPKWYGILAANYNSSGDERKKIYALERLAMLLPQNSLWRVRYKSDFEAIKMMELTAEASAAAAGAYYYDHGLKSGNLNSFMKSAGLYESLISYKPHADKSNNWRLRVAHCYFFSSRNDEAAKHYSDLITNYRLDEVTLEVASYQLVLTREKNWRGAFTNAVKKGEDAKKSPVVEEVLASLRKSVDRFVNRFPRRSRSVDLLLVMGSAYRDQGRDNDAIKYWERVLVSKPSNSQRASAVRGLIASSIRSGESKKVVSLATRFLKLEDWKSLGVNLGNELRGVVSTAALDESKRLNNSGEVAEAGIFLIQIGKEFKELPDREKILRDGAYMLAIAGEWSSAEQAAEFYQSQGLKKYGGDMQYLLARSYEFQVRFSDASRAYLELAKRYPRHSRAMTSLRRAESLAVSDNDFETAGIAAKLIADRSKKSSDKTASYARSAELFSKGENSTQYLAVADKNRKVAKTPTARISAELTYAKALHKDGKGTAYIKSLNKISRSLSVQKTKLDSSFYRGAHGEVHFLLGEESRAIFVDYNIYERGANLGENIRQKNVYYKNMVQHYSDVVNGNDPKWAPQARYLIAETSEDYADDLSGVSRSKLAGNGASLGDKSKKSSERLRRIAKKYLSNNLLERRKDPRQYVNNEWIKKSSIRLSGYGVIDDNESIDSLPTASYTDIPTQWSP